MKERKHMPLLLMMTAFSMLIISLLSIIGTQGAYQKYNTNGWAQPAVSALMQGLADHTYPWNAQTDEPVDTIPLPLTTTEISAVLTPLADTQFDTQQEPGAPEQYEFTEVSQDYFDDALFIGDSRVVGVELYSGWDNLTYYAEGGLNVYNMFKRELAEDNGKKISVETALNKYSFGKIYLEIGINELGTGNIDSFMKAYEDAVCHLRELQPDAIIFLCSIMYVEQSRSETDAIFNNENIQARNDRIAQLADQKDIFYLDINEVVTDETGNLNPDYTWDDVHLLGKYHIIWLEYFCKHGIVKEP